MNIEEVFRFPSLHRVKSHVSLNISGMRFSSPCTFFWALPWKIPSMMRRYRIVSVYSLKKRWKKSVIAPVFVWIMLKIRDKIFCCFAESNLRDILSSFLLPLKQLRFVSLWCVGGKFPFFAAFVLWHPQMLVINPITGEKLPDHSVV